jgi:LmbE family N-acetylglucosaminyl deacetylase
LNILAFRPSDDETMLAGGTLALRGSGARVHYLCATREGGETGEPPLTTNEQLGEVREQEMVCAVRPWAAGASHFWATGIRGRPG